MEPHGSLAEQLKQQFRTDAEKRITKAHEVGQVLYHYTRLDSLMGMVETNQLWMSKGTFLNDSSELVYVASIIRDVIQTLSDRCGDSPSQLFCLRKLDDAVDRFMAELDQGGLEVFVFSLSHAQDSLALWYNYAQGEGYNIGFSADALLQKVSAFLRQDAVLHGFVVYDKQEQESILMDFVLKSLNLIEGNKEAEEALMNHFFSVVSTCAVFFKEAAFKSEEEYRIAFMQGNREKRLPVRFRSQNGVIIPYITIDFDDRLPIRHVTVGPKNNIDIAQHGVDYYLKSKGYNMEQVEISKSVAALRY